MWITTEANPCCHNGAAAVNVLPYATMHCGVDCVSLWITLFRCLTPATVWGTQFRWRGWIFNIDAMFFGLAVFLITLLNGQNITQWKGRFRKQILLPYSVIYKGLLLFYLLLHGMHCVLVQFWTWFAFRPRVNHSRVHLKVNRDPCLNQRLDELSYQPKHWFKGDRTALVWIRPWCLLS